MAQEERSSASLRLENDRLRRQVKDLRTLMRIARENLELRSTLQGFSSGRGGEAHQFSGMDLTVAPQLVDESEFRSGLVVPRRTSSPLGPSYHKGIQTTPEPSDRASSSHQKPKEPGRLLGEIGFQLDRRIVSYVFHDRSRLYGFTARNVPDKIIEVSTHPLTGRPDEAYRRELTDRHALLMEQLGSLGYNQTLHPPFTELVVNTYGILQKRPDSRTSHVQGYEQPGFLRDVVTETAPAVLQKDLLLLLACLCYMADKDGQPLLLW